MQDKVDIQEYEITDLEFLMKRMLETEYVFKAYNTFTNKFVEIDHCASFSNSKEPEKLNTSPGIILLPRVGFDMNNESIFLGDILSNKSKDWFVRLVKGDFGGVIAEHSRTLQFISGIGEPINDPQTASYISQECYVIGNIFTGIEKEDKKDA